MKQSVSYISFLLFTLMILMIYPSVSAAQKNEVIKTTFEVKEGKIIIYLPGLSPKANISGTVNTEPSGRSSKEFNKNTAALKNYQLQLGDTPISIQDGLFNIQLPQANISKAIPLLLKNQNGKTVATEDLSLTGSSAQAPGYFLPTYIVSGDPATIRGSFDGNHTNTSVTVNGEKAILLAESASHLYFRSPDNPSGKVQLACNENGNVQTTTCNILKLDLGADKTNLSKGEQTNIHIKVSGLQDLKENVPLTIQNLSTTVSLQGGSSQQITIDPLTDAVSGIYEASRNVQAITSGGFAINVAISPPRDPTAGQQLLCNCYLNQQTHLVPAQTCITLGGTLEPPPTNNNQSHQTGAGPTNPPIVSFPPPAPMNIQTDEIMLQLTASANDVTAVIFSERRVSQTEWNPVGYAVNTGNNWSYNWTAPIGNDGEHVIRARIAGKNNLVVERFTQTHIQLSPYTLNPAPGENFNLTVSERDIRVADQQTKQITDSLRRLQEKLDALQKKYEELQKQQIENTAMAGELAAIDRVIDQVPGIYRDSLKALIDSLNNLKTNLPAKIDPAALQKAADDAAQRQKDCEDRLAKLKQEKDKVQKDLDAMNKQISDLLNKMDQLHLGNNWVGGHGYHSDGGFWYGYVGDERSNTNINAESNAISNQLKGLKGPQNKANDRAKALNAEIAAAEAECDKLKKEQAKAEQAVKDGNQYAATEIQADELYRQIEELMSALKNWCAAHPGVCNFDPELSGKPKTPAELQDYMNKLDDIIKKKQQKETDLKNEAEENAANSQSTEEEIKAGQGDKEALEGEQAKAQAGADQLRKEREEQLEAERVARQKKIDEENAKRNTPKPVPVLDNPIYPYDLQLKTKAWNVLSQLNRDNIISRKKCDCIKKAIALSKNTNHGYTEVLGGMAVAVAFAPLEAFPGLSFAARLGIGAAKAIGSAFFGGENFSDELAKNLFNVIGGEIFPKLLGSEIAGASANSFAGKGLEALLKEEGVRVSGWEGETEVEGCGKVKGKTTMLFNPNTGWVTLIIKVDDCIVVVKYQVNKDGVAISKPIVTQIKG